MRKAEGTSDGQVSSNTWYLFPHYEVKKTGTSPAVVYGRRLDTGGDTSGERDFTGQQVDATGLLYYNARYYSGVDKFREVNLTKGTFIFGGTPGQSHFYTTDRFYLGSSPESLVYSNQGER